MRIQVGYRDKEGGFDTRRMIMLSRVADGTLKLEEIGPYDNADLKFIESIREDIERMKALGVDNLNISMPDF